MCFLIFKLPQVQILRRNDPGNSICLLHIREWRPQNKHPKRFFSSYKIVHTFYPNYGFDTFFLNLKTENHSLLGELHYLHGCTDSAMGTTANTNEAHRDSTLLSFFFSYFSPLPLLPHPFFLPSFLLFVHEHSVENGNWSHFSYEYVLKERKRSSFLLFLTQYLGNLCLYMETKWLPFLPMMFTRIFMTFIKFLLHFAFNIGVLIFYNYILYKNANAYIQGTQNWNTINKKSGL